MAAVKLPKKEVSYWMDSTKDPKYPKLSGDLTTDVVVIGGGIAGLSAAYLLKQSGKKVIVLEKSVIGGSVTGHTTGKVTSQHNLIYKKLKERMGEKDAANYGQANQAAIKTIKNIIAKEKIACDFENDDNYVFTEKDNEVEKLHEEAEVAKSLGLPATFVTKTGLPFEVRGAVKFAGQGKMHARKYVLGLAKAVNGQGSHVFEHIEAEKVHDGLQPAVTTDNGTIKANDIIIATNVPYPLMTHVAYSIYEYPMKSYIVAAHVKEPIKGMYINTGSPLFSILPITSGKDKLILVGGQSHFLMLGGRTDAHYERLAAFAKEKFGVKAIDYKWSAYDYLSYDKAPLVGKIYPWSKHVYVTTAFMKWGFTNTTVSGMILCDMILGRKNKWQETFVSNRLSAITAIPRWTVESALSLPGFFANTFGV